MSRSPHERSDNLLAALRGSMGLTVIIVSHDQAVAERADRLVRIVDGRVEDD